MAANSNGGRRGGKTQLDSLQEAIGELRDNLGSRARHQDRDLGGEFDRLKGSLSQMMDLFMRELDSVKKDLYVDFGETQKLIAGDINQIRADQIQVQLRVDLLEKQKNRQVSHEVESRLDSLEQAVANLRPGVLKKSTKTESVGKYAKLIDGNSEQIEVLQEQNQRIEEFLEEVVNMLRKNQKTTVELNQKLIAAEADMSLYKKELSDLFKDFEGRYGFFQQSAQSDAGNLVKLQKETNKTIENFMAVVTKKNATTEETVKERLDGFQTLMHQISKRELNDEYLKEISDKLATVEEKQTGNDRRVAGLEAKLGNFRNEVNTLFVDYETDLNNKWTEMTSAIGTMAKLTNTRNPLLV